jgi:hypothetical protein
MKRNTVLSIGLIFLSLSISSFALDLGKLKNAVDTNLDIKSLDKDQQSAPISPQEPQQSTTSMSKNSGGTCSAMTDSTSIKLCEQYDATRKNECDSLSSKDDRESCAKNICKDRDANKNLFCLSVSNKDTGFCSSIRDAKLSSDCRLLKK